MWNKLSSKVILKHPHLIVEEDKVQTQDNKTLNYLRYGYDGDGVVLVARNEQDQLLFVREYSYVPNQRLLQLPMGKIEIGEKPEEAANRELQEETGFKAKQLYIIGSYFQNHRRSVNKAYVILASGLTPSKLMADPEEQDIEQVWLTAKDISALVSNGDIRDTDTLSSLRISSL
jgi:ADP-ribose pyrophosphatase